LAAWLPLSPPGGAPRNVGSTVGSNCGLGTEVDALTSIVDMLQVDPPGTVSISELLTEEACPLGSSDSDSVDPGPGTEGRLTEFANSEAGIERNRDAVVFGLSNTYRVSNIGFEFGVASGDEPEGAASVAVADEVTSDRKLPATPGGDMEPLFVLTAHPSSATVRCRPRNGSGFDAVSSG
jgi:hypothetical protein